FDLGETLWTRIDKDSLHRLEEVANQRAIATLYEHISPENLPNTNLTSIGHQLRRTVEAETRALGRQAPAGHEPDFALATQRALHALGILEVDQEPCAALFEALRVRISESRVLFSDVLPTLAELKRRGFVLGVVTNRQYGGKLFLEDLQTLGLLDYFAPEHIAISADLAIRKPNPAIFMNTLNALGVAPEEAAMVGDNLDADVSGAQQLNIFAIWKPKLTLRARAYTSHTLQRKGGNLVQASGDGERDHLASVTTQTTPVDHDYLLEYIHQHDIQYYQYFYHKPQPDLIIEHLSDLLTVFQKAGKQQ
ncbi:MAG TPA: HAD-IA family hydrolase, partial [Ktedonosporobacter sp.]|nr:HAD-IA family hydrolase [Ktedonosporobacter sp.]